MENELETTVTYYDNGQKKEEYFLRDNVPEGDWTHWYENGQKRSVETYVGIGFYGTPKEREGCHISNTICEPHGLSISWYENGQKSNEYTQIFGHPCGLDTERYENGQKKSEGNWTDLDVQDGPWTYWNEEGNVTKTEMYRGGELV